VRDRNKKRIEKGKMEFDIDVSGDDIFSNDYTICIANKDSIIKGYKMTSETNQIILSRYGQEFYRYKKSKKNKSQLKVRIYCIIIYYLFKSLKGLKKLTLNICRDFDGKEQDIKNNLDYFLKETLGIGEVEMNFKRLDRDSAADKYAYIMRKDDKNKMKTYVKISIKEIEKFLKK